MFATKFSTKMARSDHLSSTTSSDRALSRLLFRQRGRLIPMPSSTSTTISELQLFVLARLIEMLTVDPSLDSANAKLQAVVNLVKQVNSGGTKLIDGIGTQMHLSVRDVVQV